MARQSPAPSRQLHYNGDHMLIITVSREYSIIHIVYIQHTFALEAMMKLKRLGTDCTDDSSVPPVASASSLYTSKSSPVADIQPPSTKTKCTCTPFPVAAESTWCLSMDVELGGVSVMSKMGAERKNVGRTLLVLFGWLQIFLQCTCHEQLHLQLLSNCWCLRRSVDDHQHPTEDIH